jgi:hypothetical protein
MKATIVFAALLIGVTSAINLNGRSLEPLSDNIVEYINKLGTTWTAEKSKFHSWSLKEFKRTLGVPLNHIGKPSSLPINEHKVDLKDIPG